MTNEQLVEALIARMKRIKVANGYWMDVADEDVFFQKLQFDPPADNLPAITILFHGGPFQSVGTAPRYYDKLPSVAIIGVFLADPDDPYRALRFLEDLKEAAMTPITGDAMDRALNALIPQSETVVIPEPGDAYEQINLLLAPQYCDDSVTQEP